MQYYYYCLVFLSTVSVAVLIDVKKIYVIQRDFKTGQLRARRQNVPTPSHTQARVGALDHHLHQQMFSVSVSPPPLQAATSGQQQPLDLASTVDLTADNRGTPIDYLTPPPNADFQFQNFQPSAGAAEAMTHLRTEQHQQNAASASATAAVQAVPPPPLASATTTHTSPFIPSGSFPSAPATASSLGLQLAQASSPTTQVHSLTLAGQPLEQFTPYTPTLVHEPAANHALQLPHHVQQQQNTGGRWELGYDASDILTPPFAGGPEQAGGGGGGGGGGGQTFGYQQEFGPEPASSVRNIKQVLGGGGGGGGTFFGGGFEPVNSNKFTPLDAVIRSSPSSNNNVYWGTPKTAQQQQPLRPPPTFAEPNAYRFNNNINNGGNHLHHGHHVSSNNHHQHQYVDAFQMPFTGQFDGPLSQGTVADHVVHSTYRIKRRAIRDEAMRSIEQDAADDRDDDDRDGDLHDRDERFGDHKPVYSFVKTDRNGNFKWSVRHGY